jgi:hypothetical protein
MASTLPDDDLHDLHSLLDTASHDIKTGEQAQLFMAGLEAVVQEVAKLSDPSMARLSKRPRTSPGLLLAELASIALGNEAEQRSLTPTEKLAKAHLKGIVALRQLLADHGGTYSPSEVAQLLGISRQAVNKRTRHNQLLAIYQGDKVAYPVWQFAGNGLVPHFVDILQALDTNSQIAKVRFFLSSEESLDSQSTLDALKAGEHKQVLRLAQRFGKQGAA